MTAHETIATDDLFEELREAQRRERREIAGRLFDAIARAERGELTRDDVEWIGPLAAAAWPVTFRLVAAPQSGGGFIRVRDERRIDPAAVAEAISAVRQWNASHETLVDPEANAAARSGAERILATLRESYPELVSAMGERAAADRVNAAHSSL